MGLDSYLYKESYVKNWSFHTPEEKHSVVVSKGGKPRTDIQPERVSYIIETVAYWRKFNAIHNWFVNKCADGVDECQKIYVSVEELKELLETLTKVYDVLKDYEPDFEKVDEEVRKLFPPTSGFFFGSTDIDGYFYQDVTETIDILTELLDEKTDGFVEYYYRASW